jgi:hypothetical protein
METPKIESNKSANDSEIADATSIESTGKKDTGRKLQDNIISRNSNRRLIQDRRAARSDRRTHTDPNYKGPTSRYTIDRRRNRKDRRKID